MQHVHTLRVDMHRLSVDDPVGSKLSTNTSSVTIEYLGVG